MILIADSGSTKTDWILYNSNTQKQENFETVGFNPTYNESDYVTTNIQKNIALCANANLVETIYFFGAGCSSHTRNTTIKNALQTIFTNAKITVDHDLLGAAIALCGNNDGIACIVGTGSNSVLYKNKELIEPVANLGYILGDEASGAFFGKHIVRDFIYLRLPKNIHHYIVETYNLDKEIIIENVYRKPNPNTYLATFASILTLFKEDDYIQNLLNFGFDEFIKYHITCYDNYQKYDTNFVGSIATIFKENILNVGKKYDVQFGKFVQKPIDEIAKYYIQNL